MGVDLPDNTQQVTITYEGGFIGLEELATRLGFIAPFDLHGNLVMMEDFETEVTEWTESASAGSITPERTSRRKWSGNWSERLETGDELNGTSTIRRSLPYPTGDKIALFCRLLLDDNVQVFDIEVNLHPSGWTNYFMLRYTRPTTTLEVWDEGVGWTPVTTTLLLGGAAEVWYPIVLVGNNTTGIYDKVIFGEQEVDLSAYEARHVNIIEYRYSNVIIRNRVYTVDAVHTGYTLYVDDVVMVENVP